MGLVIQYVFVLVLLIIFSIKDIQTRTVPWRWVMASVLGTILIRCFYSPEPWWHYLLTGLCILLGLLMISISLKDQLGGGDIQLFGWLGLSLGFYSALFVLIGTLLLTIVYGLIRKRTFPVVPFMLISFMTLLIMEWKVGAL
ncbi:prepilin peptidase [Paenibacillus enshidis]|uniref:Prepilin peptidase n=1 Tax=Paenibacillus enshidis TaxID=1458439 RepID=A0ABV5AVA3_9BACL